MYFEQFYLACLSQASYMIGSGGVAAVVDPQRDVDLYLEEARLHGLRIAYVIETHVHADFVSGHRELAARTGALIYVGAKAQAEFAHVPVQDGDELSFGFCRLQFLETPGHTLESISVLITDFERSSEPFAVLTGDTLFVGDVGRPDLGTNHTPGQLAALLYDSLHAKLLTLPDAVRVFPAHGAGSLCGRQMSTDRSSTIGRERATNHALRAANRDAFVRLLTAELPERPRYFARDAQINRAGPTPLAQLATPAPLEPGAVLDAQRRGAVVLDTRAEDDFGTAHVPLAVNIGLSGQFAAWAGTILGLDSELVVVADDDDHVHEAWVRLARVGIERVGGYLAGGMRSWRRADFPVTRVPQISVDQLDALLADHGRRIQIVDVRRRGEWEAGHLDGARHKPLDRLSTVMDDLDRALPVAAYCKGGYRSSVATSLLRRAGFEDVLNVSGGFDAWLASGLPHVA